MLPRKLVENGGGQLVVHLSHFQVQFWSLFVIQYLQAETEHIGL